MKSELLLVAKKYSLLTAISSVSPLQKKLALSLNNVKYQHPYKQKPELPGFILYSHVFIRSTF